MNFEEFTYYIKKNILDDWMEDACVCIRKIKKNNGTNYTGVYIKEEDTTISPAIYLEEFYDSYLEGRSMDGIIRDIRRRYEESMMRIRGYTVDIGNYANLKDRIIYRLINYDRNRDMLAACPHVRMEDLAVTFRWVAYEDSIGISTGLVSNREMELWGVGLQDLLLDAQRNTEHHFPAKIILMDQFLEEICPTSIEFEDTIPMYILTNEQQINGASVILYEGFLKDFVAMHPGDYYIIPSSVHEVILVPAEDADVERLKEIVRQANESVVLPEEVLSDTVYYYDGHMDCMRGI